MALKDAAAQAAESLRSAEAANVGLEEKLQHSGQELRDLAAAKDARCAAAPASAGLGASACPGLLGAGLAVGPRLLSPLILPPFQDKGLRGQTKLCAALQEEGRGGVQEEVSVPGSQPGRVGLGPGRGSHQPKGHPAFEFTALGRLPCSVQDFLSGS